MVVVGSPYLGADASGAVALTAGVCAAAAIAVGGWLTSPGWSGRPSPALAVTAGFARAGPVPPEDQRSSVGRLLVRTQDGTAGYIARRIGEANVVTTVTSPLTILVIGASCSRAFVLLRDWGGLRRLLGLSRRSGRAGRDRAGHACSAGSWKGSSLNVLGAALATAVPLAVLAAPAGARPRRRPDPPPSPHRPVGRLSTARSRTRATAPRPTDDGADRTAGARAATAPARAAGRAPRRGRTTRMDTDAPGAEHPARRLSAEAGTGASGGTVQACGVLGWNPVDRVIFTR